MAVRICLNVSRSRCSFWRWTETFTRGITPSVMMVITVMVITNSISERPCSLRRSVARKGTRRPALTLFTQSPRCWAAYCLYPFNILLFHCCGPLDHLRHHVLCVSGNQVQPLLVEHERGVACSDGFDVDEDQWPRSAERNLPIERRDRYQAHATRIDRRCKEWCRIG